MSRAATGDQGQPQQSRKSGNGTTQDKPRLPQRSLPAPGDAGAGADADGSQDRKKPEGERPKSDGPKDQDEKGKAEKEKGEKDQGGEEGENQPQKPPVYKRPLFWIILASVVVVGTIIGVAWWLMTRDKVGTDDAFIAAHSTSVSPRVSGHVIDVKVDDNQEVKAGDLLVVLDDRDFQQALKANQAALEQARAQLVQAQAQLASAKAQVSQAQADVASAQANANQAQSDLQRYLNVQNSDPRAVSRQQVDQAIASARTTAAQLEASRQKQGAAEAQVNVAQSQIVAAQAAIDKSQADVENARLQLSYTQIRAADDGQVTTRSVEVGNYVTPGQAMMALVPTTVYVTANYKETQLKNVRVGQPVKIHVDAYNLDLWGHVQSIQAGSGAAFSLLPPENATGNYVKVVQRVPVKITLDHPPPMRLAPGLSVEPTIDTSQH